MYRIDNTTSASVLPTPAAVGPNPNSYFTSGNAGGGIPATIVDQDWANAVQEEICYVIEQSGATLSKTTRTQLLAAIKYFIQNNIASYATSTSAANTYTATFTPALAAYVTGSIFAIKFTNHNTGAATLNVNSLGAKNIKNLDGSALSASDIADGMIALFSYDGTNLQLLNKNMATVIANINTAITNNGYTYAASTSSPNTYTATLTPALTAYTTGMTVVIKFTNANTSTTPTLNLNSLGAVNIVHKNGTALNIGDIAAGMIAKFSYDGTNFQLESIAQDSNMNMNLSVCEARLTLTSGVPVTSSDVTAATNIYMTPYKGNKIYLYDGSANWNLLSFTELTLAVPATTSTMYDIFAYNNSGVVAIEALAWTNDTTRATALVYQNGVLVKSGATTRRYIGSFRTTGSSGQTEDSKAKRYVWNYYNRVMKLMSVVESTNSWNYSTGSFRQANNSTANQLDFIVGYSEDSVYATAASAVLNSSGTVRQSIIGIGLNSTTVNSAQISVYISASNTFIGTGVSVYQAVVAVGRNFLAWLESGAGADTQTWFGTNAGAIQTGIVGELLG